MSKHSVALFCDAVAKVFGRPTRASLEIILSTAATYCPQHYLIIDAPEYGSCASGAGGAAGRVGLDLPAMTISEGPVADSPMSACAIAGAPNRMKHPAIVMPPRRQSIRPVNIAKPTNAIARTAMLVASCPVASATSHSLARRIVLG